MTERTRTRREPLPNLRGEDETEIQLLTQLIESGAWMLSPLRPPTCVIGRIPPEEVTDGGPKYCVSLYSMGNGGVKGLDSGPKHGLTRKEALSKLLFQVETELGRMMITDKREKREREEVRDREERRAGGSGNN
ncbi:hypothetical protein HBI56_080840 [Parastagonospora nodorum]|uniref:Uncharacterized protein n=2 Tax=Phaeosphaeria nodorum (strain SN15 / ATCC MYA-4574 / FGSC 10173) TaxID=321614 RepID=Q0UBZ2_PHANO|nr:hypothetical protein SNOG_10722 [Parastagonospora nodorum SN15]KAH3913645.1 hypothetical protein HBH56_105860 [Parastagonospora nodorum]EAT82116.1 hypothetical protein SNOG_10722 [Parastagonospora nodorum SN15]KAH3929628.1 hypothetical protein HBH54_124550 [Parastagonospora nodorum]KAH3951637.1 hypothetical protein HBH53_058550 [Parastagonospora nodorum]KAH3975458.1 hypothetical protein HBH52_128320 [Parastagonospora nodorum]